MTKSTSYEVTPRDGIVMQDTLLPMVESETGFRMDKNVRCAMKTYAALFAAEVVLLAAFPLLAHGQRTGISNPPPTPITNDSDADVPPAKPSAAIPFSAQAPDANNYATASAAGASAPQPAADVYRPYSQTGGNSYVSTAVADDVNEGIVTRAPSIAGGIPDGTLVKVRLRQELSTAETESGSTFQAEVTEPLMKDGQVIVPAGAVLDGRVTMVEQGHGLSGGSIHLETRTLTLADGSHFVLRARVIDTDRYKEVRVDSEGTIIKREWTKRSGTEVGVATGSSALVGGVIAGPPGALIGAGVGAGAGTVLAVKQSHHEVLPKGTGIVFCLTVPMMTTPARGDVY